MRNATALTATMLALNTLTINAQTEADLNGLYKHLKPSHLSLLLRESPQNLKKVYGTAGTKGLAGDTLWVANGTAPMFAKLVKSLHWNLVPVELPADTMRALPPAGEGMQARDVNGATFNMVKVEGGPNGKTYLIGQTEVTQRLWITIMYSNPSLWTELESGWPSYNQPVENISWKEVNDFIARLNKTTGRRFRLPTAKEWEFAAKGGLKGQGHKYAGSDTLAQVGWAKPEFVIGSGPHDVAQKEPNELGLYDMSGNVWEMCADHFGRGSAEWFILKGGCANAISADCTVSRKKVLTTNNKSGYIGFRLVEDVE